jgi:hypothetical protein
MKALSRHRLSLLVTGLVVVPLLALAQGTAKFEVVPGYFPAQPDGKACGPLHGGASVDRAGNVYISSDTDRGILVFGPDGKYLRCCGPTQIHGLFLRREGNEDFLYAARPNFNEVLKLTTDGKEVWKLGCPMESGKYANEKEFHPTNVVSTPDGSIFVADGYGKKWIHKYDADRKFVKSFGGPGTVTPAEEGKFNTCHGLAVDRRQDKALLVVCNRESGRVEHWDTDGNFVKVLIKDLRMPAAAHVNRNYIAIAELGGRVTVLDKEGKLVTQFGDNPDTSQRANFGLAPDKWKDGIVNAAHGISFDRQGNLIVAEWNQFGRVSKFALKQ